MIQLTVTTKETGMRLDAWLAVRLGVSRSRVQQWIKDGLITQKGSTVIAHNRLKAGEEFVCEADLALPKKVAKKLPKLDVVFENKDVLVVNKPAGLLVHPNTPDEKHPTLAEAAVAHDPSIAGVGENELRPGIVHRLDKEVSGVIVIAKTAEAFESLKDQFTKHETEKHYVALAYGKITKDHDFIKLKIARSKKRGRMVARPDSQEGKEAITEFRVIGRYKIATLLDVRTHTGRTHQIRTHFFAINHPLVGDKLYKKPTCATSIPWISAACFCTPQASHLNFPMERQ